MTTVGQSSYEVKGEIGIASMRRSTKIALTGSVGGLECKGPIEMTIAPNSSLNLPLNLSPGVTEILMLALYAPRKLVVRVTTSDLDTPGPVEKGIKGSWLEMLTPGQGITAITVKNPSTTSAVTFEYATAALADPADAPEYFDDDVTG